MEKAWIQHLASHFCHQDAARSFRDDYFLVPFCVRCSGFYAAFGASVLLLVTLDRRVLNPLHSLMIAIAFAGLMALDALVWPTSNPQRYSTGILAGATMGLVATPLVRGRVATSGSNLPLRVSACLRVAGIAAFCLLVTGGLVPVLLPPLVLLTLFGFAAVAWTVHVLIVGFFARTPRVVLLTASALFLAELGVLIFEAVSTR